MIARTRFSKNLANGRFSHSGSHLYHMQRHRLNNLPSEFSDLQQKNMIVNSGGGGRESSFNTFHVDD